MKLATVRGVALSKRSISMGPRLVSILTVVASAKAGDKSAMAKKIMRIKQERRDKMISSNEELM